MGKYEDVAKYVTHYMKHRKIMEKREKYVVEGGDEGQMGRGSKVGGDKSNEHTQRIGEFSHESDGAELNFTFVIHHSELQTQEELQERLEELRRQKREEKYGRCLRSRSSNSGNYDSDDGHRTGNGGGDFDWDKARAYVQEAMYTSDSGEWDLSLRLSSLPLSPSPCLLHTMDQRILPLYACNY